MQWLSDIRLPAEPSGVREARLVADTVEAPISDQQREDLRLLVSEVATNAIRHGGSAHTTAGAPGTIRIRLGVEGSRLRVEVHDRGPGFTPTPRGSDSQLDSGWGVHFVRTLADRWGSGHDETGAWIVWFEFGLPRDAGTDHDGMLYGQRTTDGAPLTYRGEAQTATSHEGDTGRHDAVASSG